MTDDEHAVLAAVCERAGLNPEGAVLLGHHVNAVHHLPRASAVVRVGPERRMDQAAAGVRVTRWLWSLGFPVTAPLDVAQPVRVGGHVATFWRYYEPGGRGLPHPRVLARLLRHLHGLDPPPFALPVFRPLDSFIEELAVHGPVVLGNGEYEFLRERAVELPRSYQQLTSELGHGVIHADARLRNLLWDGDTVVLADWDSISIGPREVDLAITYQGKRYGRSEADMDEFGRVYGWDVRRWPGYTTLRDIRDLQTLSALLRLAASRVELAEELHHRVRGLMAGDDSQQWRSF